MMFCRQLYWQTQIKLTTDLKFYQNYFPQRIYFIISVQNAQLRNNESYVEPMCHNFFFERESNHRNATKQMDYNVYLTQNAMVCIYTE